MIRYLMPVLLACLLAPMHPAHAEESESGKSLGAAAGKAWDGVKTGSREAWEAAKEGGGEAWDATKEGSKEVWEATKEGADALRKKVGGAISGE